MAWWVRLCPCQHAAIIACQTPHKPARQCLIEFQDQPQPKDLQDKLKCSVYVVVLAPNSLQKCRSASWHKQSQAKAVCCIHQCCCQRCILHKMVCNHQETYIQWVSCINLIRCCKASLHLHTCSVVHLLGDTGKATGQGRQGLTPPAPFSHTQKPQATMTRQQAYSCCLTWPSVTAMACYLLSLLLQPARSPPVAAALFLPAGFWAPPVTTPEPCSLSFPTAAPTPAAAAAGS